MILSYIKYTFSGTNETLHVILSASLYDKQVKEALEILRR